MLRLENAYGSIIRDMVPINRRKAVCVELTPGFRHCCRWLAEDKQGLANRVNAGRIAAGDKRGKPIAVAFGVCFEWPARPCAEQGRQRRFDNEMRNSVAWRWGWRGRCQPGACAGAAAYRGRSRGIGDRRRRHLLYEHGVQYDES